MRERTLDGYWWRPDNPDDRVAGIATFDGARTTLRLLGAFVDRRQTAPDTYQQEPVERALMVLGRCEGVPVTLLDCRQGRSVGPIFSKSWDWRQSWNISQMLVGVWLDDPQEPYFDRLVLGVDQLLPWSRRSGFTSPAFMTIAWTSPGVLSAEVPGGTITLRTDAGSDEEAQADGTERRIEEQTKFVVDVPEPSSAQALLGQWAKTLQDLVTFATNTPCGLNEVTLVRKQPPVGDQADEPRSDRPHVVEAYLSPIYQARPTARAVEPHQVLFNLDDVPFEDLLPAWFDVDKRLGAVVAMLLGQRYIERSFMENRLITSVAAAEGLHRRLLPDEVHLDPQQFKPMRTVALKTVPVEHRDWFAGQLRNELSLRNRLLQLVERVGEDAVSSFIPDAEQWARAATNARNLLAHRFEDDSEQSLDGPAMYVLAQMTSAVITLVLLQELGVPTERIRHLTAHHETFRWIREEGRRHVLHIFEAHDD